MINIKKSVLNRIILIISVVTISLLFLIFLSSQNNSENSNLSNSNSVVVEDSKQIINIKAKNGYSPYIIEAKANVDSILRVNTNNTFDCSLALRIPTLNVDQMLPITGNTDFNIPSQESGNVINGTCSMGMYSFKINFVD